MGQAWLERGDTVAGPALEWEEIGSLAGLRRLEPEWRKLFVSSPDLSPFQSPDWLVPWAERFAPERLVCIAARRGGRLAGLAAFYVHRLPSGERQLTLLGNGLSDRLDLICAEAEGDQLASGVLSWLSRSRGWDVADLRDLPAGSALARQPAPGSLEDRLEPDVACPVASLPRDPTLWCAGLPKARRTDLRRTQRRLEAIGPVALETVDEGARAQALAELIRLHSARWAEKGEPGALEDGAVQAFHECATRRLLAAGNLRLHVLKVAGQVIAAHYALVHGRRAYSYLHSFDPAYAPSGAGALLLAYAMEDAIRCGAESFDFLRGREPYKYAWGAHDQPQVRRRLAWVAPT